MKTTTFIGDRFESRFRRVFLRPHDFDFDRLDAELFGNLSGIFDLLGELLFLLLENRNFELEFLDLLIDVSQTAAGHLFANRFATQVHLPDDLFELFLIPLVVAGGDVGSDKFFVASNLGFQFVFANRELNHDRVGLRGRVQFSLGDGRLGGLVTQRLFQGEFAFQTHQFDLGRRQFASIRGELL